MENDTLESLESNLRRVRDAGFDTSQLTTINGKSAVVIECPGESAHTNATGYYDTVIFLDGPNPTAYCLHNSCRHHIKKLNNRLFTTGEKSGSGPANAQAKPIFRKSTPNRARALQNQLRKKALILTPSIKRDFQWSTNAAITASPTKFTTKAVPEGHWDLHLKLFKGRGQGEVWLGETSDTGFLEKHMHFWPVQDWLDWPKWFGQDIPIYPLTSPCLFKPLGHSRCKANVSSVPFFVIEHDGISHESQLAYYRFLRESLGLRLRALIDTAGKSIHAWWDYPSQKMVEQLKPMLETWGFDMSVTTPSQPVRVAGVPRLRNYHQGTWDENFLGWQRLLYIDLNT